MPLRILVSADSNQKHFVSCIRKVCRELGVEFHFLTEEVASASEKDRLERMRNYVTYTDLILMDVTPHTFPSEGEKYRYSTNQGVLIEYGVIIALEEKRWRLKLFCEEAVERKHLHPYVLKTVESYSCKKLGSLERKVAKIIELHHEDIIKKQRIQERQVEAFKKLLTPTNISTIA